MDVLLESWKRMGEITDSVPSTGSGTVSTSSGTESGDGQRTMDNSSFLIPHSSLLTIVGDGPERARLEGLIERLGIQDSVRLVGQVDMETYYSYIAQADVVVNPCFREGAVTVSFDSMAMGKPLICFDTGGYTHSFEPGYSRVIKGVTSREEAVERLAQAMAELADKELCVKMGAEAKRRSEELSWEKRGEVFSAIL